MVRKQFSMRPPERALGLAGALDAAPENVRRAFFEAISAYEATGVRFAVVGGLAAAAYGEPRMTRDVDFLVGDEGFVHTGSLISFAFHFPLQSHGVAIDTIALPVDETRWEVLDAELSEAVLDTSTGRQIPVISARGLAFMKLLAMRPKDRHDIVSMLLARSLDLAELGDLVKGDSEMERALGVIMQDYERALEE